MSGPDDRRPGEGGEPPLDVDARFADIVAHFHDGEPAEPTLVDDATTDPAPSTGVGGAGAAERDAGEADAGTPGVRRPADRGPEAWRDHDFPDDTWPDEDPVQPQRPPAGRSRKERSQDDRGPDGRTLDPQAEQDAADAERAARIAAEVDRAVDGPDGNRYEPPEPPPIPRPTDLPGRLAWGAVLLGPVLLLLCAMVWTSAPQWFIGAVATGIVAGFGYLVWRLPRNGDRHDPDDGAVV